MNNLANTIDNNVLAAFGQQAPKGVMNAIQTASAKTGVDFAYLVQQAAAESSFDPNAKAKTSSATGLYQFIESTWLSMVEKYGAEHGIETDGKSRKEILELRKDPQIAANLAAEFAGENEKFLEDHWARGEKEIGSTELYLAHFLGAGGAAGFLNARDDNPLQKAAYIFPEAAKANQNVFYNRGTGEARSFDEIYAFFDKKFEIKGEAVPQSEPAPIHQDIASESLLAFGVDNSGFETAARQIAQANQGAQDYITSSVFNSGFKELENIYGQPIGLSDGRSPFQSLVHAPIEIMLLAELDLPSFKSTSDLNDENKRALF